MEYRENEKKNGLNLENLNLNNLEENISVPVKTPNVN